MCVILAGFNQECQNWNNRQSVFRHPWIKSCTTKLLKLSELSIISELW